MENIKKLLLDDGTELDITALIYMLLTSKGNVEISSPKNINLEAAKSIKFKPGAKAQVEFYADHTGDLKEVLLRALASVDENGNELPTEALINFKFNCSELELNSKGADLPDSFDVKVKNGAKTGDTYCQVKLKGRSWDIRCMEHGGIALQINGADSSGHENCVKFESNRVSLIGQPAQYKGVGGDGMEFGRFNNDHASLFCGDYRFKADAPVYGVTRGALVEDPVTGKIDYPKQADDFQDIIADPNPVTWGDLIAAAKYLKNQGLI